MRSSTILLGAALLLCACDGANTAGGPQAGGEDFPNGLDALGRTLAQGMDSTRNWNGLDSASTDAGTGASGLADSTYAFTARSLAVCAADSSWDFAADPAFFARVTCIPGSLAGTVRDSVVFAFHPGVFEEGIDTVFRVSTDSVRSGYESLVRIRPYSRGFLLLKGDTGKFRLDARRTFGRWTDLSEAVVDGGPDRLARTDADNSYWKVVRSLVRSSDGVQDTSWALWIEPAEAGRPVIGPSDSGLARVTRLTRLAVGRRTETGLLVAHRDDSRNYARLWSAFTDRTAWGYTRFQAAYGPREDSSFLARDTIHLVDRFLSVSGSDSTRIDATAIPGPDLARHSRDSAVSIRYERHRSGRGERHTLFQIQSDEPVPYGGESKSGSVQARIDFADGTFGQFHGRWDARFFAGTWSNGVDSFSVVVRRDGVLRECTRL